MEEMNMDIIWLVCLLILLIVAYCIGRGDGRCEAANHEESFEAVKKYEIDKQFEHLRWLEERKEKKDV
jgi:hypothetical protein